MFITFDGVDGSGKTTQLEPFCEMLRKEGKTVVACRDPGGTALGEMMRSILLGDEIEFGYRAEMMLYMAARAQLVEEVIRPALAAGNVVVSDRFLLANVVYQGWAGELTPNEIWRVGEVAVNGLVPDCTFVFDINVNIASQRLRRVLDRMESRGIDYLHRVRAGYVGESQRRSEVHLIDAVGTTGEVFQRVCQAYRQLEVGVGS